MAPTDDERREVAARLRNLASHIAADEEMTLDALGLYRGENIEGYDTYGVMHLADLIDPTCTVVWKHTGSYPYEACSVCGEAFEHAPSYYTYCPSCGARLVRDDD